MDNRVPAAPHESSSDLVKEESPPPRYQCFFVSRSLDRAENLEAGLSSWTAALHPGCMTRSTTAFQALDGIGIALGVADLADSVNGSEPA